MPHLLGKFKRVLFYTFMLISLLAVTVNSVQAAGGDVSGDGSGGGSGNPLTLVSSQPATGASNVPQNIRIKLVFSKNVVNMTVKENNLKCFTLVSKDGKPLSIEVLMPDDQIQPELKREIEVVPNKGLLAGTEYNLKIAPNLTSKSGVTLGQQVVVAFSTAGQQITATKATAPESPSQPDKPLTSQANSNVAGSKKLATVQAPVNSETSATGPKSTTSPSTTVSQIPTTSQTPATSQSPTASQTPTINQGVTKEPVNSTNPQPGFVTMIVVVVFGVLTLGAVYYVFIRSQGKAQ